MNQGALVPDEVVIGLVEERLGKPDAKRRLHPRRLPAHHPAGRGARRRAGRSSVAPGSASSTCRFRRRRWSSGSAAGCSCPKDGASYHVKFTPPKTPASATPAARALITRADDKPEAIAQRLREYHDKTAPLADYYTKSGVLKSVDGVGELDRVLDRIVRALGDSSSARCRSRSTSRAPDEVEKLRAREPDRRGGARRRRGGVASRASTTWDLNEIADAKLKADGRDLGVPRLPRLSGGRCARR